MRRIDGVVLDFDGTLAPDVPQMAVEILHQVLSRRMSLPLGYLEEYFRSVLAFRMVEAIDLLLESLGVGELRTEVYASWESAAERGPLTTALEPGVEAFLRARPPGSVRIFSSAGSRAQRFSPLLALVGQDAFLDYPDRPKSDPDTWKFIASDLGWDPHHRLVVDDTPLALWAAKGAGFQTVLRTSPLVTESQIIEFRTWIDFKVDSIEDLSRRFRR